MTNLERAQSARACLKLFIRLTRVEPTEEAIGDLIANLGHLAQAEKLDFLQLLKNGIGHWTVEQQDEDGIGWLPNVIIAIDGGMSS